MFKPTVIFMRMSILGYHQTIDDFLTEELRLITSRNPFRYLVKRLLSANLSEHEEKLSRDENLQQLGLHFQAKVWSRITNQARSIPAVIAQI
jgi:hypothetical protein